MSPALWQRIWATARSFFQPPDPRTVAEWCEQELRFNEPKNAGPFSLLGREYAREWLDNEADRTITDEVFVCGSQTGKTGALMGRRAWMVANNPSRTLVVMPSITLAGSFSNTRWRPMLAASPRLAAMIPTGAARHSFKSAQQQIGGAIIDFVGSNSPANLSSNPVQRVEQDEVDKFDTGGRDEADAADLADQRTKGQTYSKRLKTSTPTLDSGLIWVAYLKGDQRRRFVPCPHCAREVVFAWAPNFSVLPKTGAEAYVDFDAGRRADGSWDLDAVEKCAAFICPHCSQRITDGHKTAMDRKGVWRATNTEAPAGYRSYHLSSLYACTPETSVGKLAVKFLLAKRSVLGLRGFINGDLAEPFVSQDRSTVRTEVIRQLEVCGETKFLLSVDVQATNKSGGYFWAVKRAWNGGDSCAVWAGPLDQWSDVEALQRTPGAEVPNVGVIVDSGWEARKDVYPDVMAHGDFYPIPQQPGHFLHVGWVPSKGREQNKMWKDPKSGLYLPWFTSPQDPLRGKAGAGQVQIDLLEFNSEWFKDLLDRLRKKESAYEWAILPEWHKYYDPTGGQILPGMSFDDYWQHMDAEYKDTVFNKRTNRGQTFWKKRSHEWPDHIKDAEIMNQVLACSLQFFVLPELEPTTKETK